MTDDSLRQDLDLPSGDMGTPGLMRVSARISLPGDSLLAFEIQAEADAPMPCPPRIFDLDGRPDICAHHLQIDADAYLPVDNDLIPAGVITQVAETGIDLRAEPSGRSGRTGWTMISASRVAENRSGP